VRVAVNVEQLLYPSPGGVGRYTAQLVAGLHRAGVQVRPFLARHPPAAVDRAWAEHGLSGVPFPKSFPLPRPLLYDAWHLLRWPPVAHRRDDIVHAPSVAVPPAGGAGLIVTVHDAASVLYPDAFSARGRWFHHQGLRAAARADRIIAVSQAAADELAVHTKLPTDRIRVVPNGVALPEPDPEALGRFGLVGERYIFWVGSLEPRKDVGTLVAAAARLARRSGGERKFKLVLAGYPGWLHDGLIAAEDRIQLGDDLRQLGRVSDGELAALYAGAAVFAFPSRHEGFGIPVLEAMASGTPVVAADIASLREVAGGAAALVTPGDADAWSEALDEVMAAGPARDHLVRAGRARAALFSWAASIEATLSVYREVTNG
jgi:glycosyltransferase involved in cell wall biosynthesis